MTNIDWYPSEYNQSSELEAARTKLIKTLADRLVQVRRELDDGAVFYSFSGKTPVSNVPIPAGHVQIIVEFKGLTTENYNDLTAFVRKLAEDHTDRLADDFNGFHGL